MVRPIWANVFNSALATITAAIIYLYPSPLVCNAGAFVIGFSAAGGILQLGVSVMSEFFPKSKAKVTSIYMMMGGLANFVIPLIRLSVEHRPAIYHCSRFYFRAAGPDYRNYCFYPLLPRFHYS